MLAVIDSACRLAAEIVMTMWVAGHNAIPTLLASPFQAVRPLAYVRVATLVFQGL
ncbi:MAG: hypothetical protein O7B27_01710 [Gammaproteobacteria bacterium]|nr:hypothetical protein [Gammaproteobacteria bacterium]